MELTPIQYLSAYFSYNLEVEVKTEHDKETHIGRMCEISNGSNHGDWIEVRFGQVIARHDANFSVSHSNQHHYFLNQDSIKPRLHPLSKLTEIIEHNGERFVPVKKLKNLDIINLELVDLDSINNWIYELPFLVILKLLEWHFDIFGLIKEGKAIEK